MVFGGAILGLTMGGPVGARTPPTVLESIDRLEKALARDDDREPTLSAVDPLLEEREAQAKKLAALRVGGKAVPPAVVYFCSDRESLDCPGLYADDTIHLYEKDFEPQFAALKAPIGFRISEELKKPAVAFLGNAGELHERGYKALRKVSIENTGRVGLAGAVGRGNQVLLVFAETPDRRRRFKFVWLVDGSTIAPRSSPRLK